MATISVISDYISEGEGSNDYRHSGYHVMQVGDSFKFGRYVIQSKLGWGRFSSIWLAWDTHKSVRFCINSKPVVKYLCAISPTFYSALMEGAYKWNFAWRFALFKSLRVQLINRSCQFAFGGAYFWFIASCCLCSLKIRFVFLKMFVTG